MRVLHSLPEKAGIGAAASRNFGAVAVPLVYMPEAGVFRSVGVHLVTLALDGTLDPLSFVVISICTDQSPIAAGEPFEPRSFVDAAVAPDLLTLALTKISLYIPPPLVHCTIFQLTWASKRQARPQSESSVALALFD